VASKKIKLISNIATIVVIIFFLFITAVSLIPKVMGLSGYFVESDSMAPTFTKGSVVFTEKVEFEDVRGTEGIKFAEYKLGDLTVKVAVASGTANANKLLKGIQSGEYEAHFIEIMACPGGCVNGGGQPIQPASVRNSMDLRAVRAKVLYDADANLPLRKSHDNPIVKMVYDEFLGEPNSHKAHELLHTHYVKRGR